MNPLMRLTMMRSGDERRDDNRVENRFRDKTGREHYDDGRFAPMRGDYHDGRNQPVRGTYDPGEIERRNYDRPAMAYPYIPPYANDRPYMGYNEPVRMGDDEEEHEGRRSWRIIENNGGVRYADDRDHPGMRRVMGFAGSRVDHPHMDEMGHRHGSAMPGHASSHAMPAFSREMAEAWMAGLQNEDGSRGAHWALEDAKALMQQRGIQTDPLRFWVALNAEYSDMCGVARKHGVDRPEFYLDSAMARWINDKDAVGDKLAAYYNCIVQH